MLRIALYSHDTLGLGHLRRCLKLAAHVRSHFGPLRGLLLTGSPWRRLFPLPDGFQAAALPAVRKTGAGRYASRDAAVDLRSVLRERRSRIARHLEAFRPHLLVIDNVPCGLHGEVAPALRAVRSRGTRTVLALRDVLDDLTAIRREWARAGSDEAVAELFDEIWVFGDQDDTAALTSGGPLENVAEKVHACGRIGLQPPHAPVERLRTDRPLVLVTGGGGQDAHPLVSTYLDAVGTFHPGITSHVVLGPDFPDGLLSPPPPPGVAIDRFVPDLAARMARSRVVVSMAGYNTVCEILASGRPAVLVPRVAPRQEQWLRARCWARRGRTVLIDPRELTAERLWTAVDDLLDAPGTAPLVLDGGRVAAKRAERLLGMPARGAA